MKMKDVRGGMPVEVMGERGHVGTMFLNECGVHFSDDGTQKYFSYDLLTDPTSDQIKPNNDNMKILVLDIETTDFLQRGGRIVEIGIVELCLATGDRRIIYDKVCHETGITREEIENAWIIKNSDLTLEEIRLSPNLDKLRSEIQSILDLYPAGCTAWNNAFDFGFFEDRKFKFPRKLPCPMKLATDVCCIQGPSGNKWPNVEEAYRFFLQKDLKEKHRGADDALHEAEIIYTMYQLGHYNLN